MGSARRTRALPDTRADLQEMKPAHPLLAVHARLQPIISHRLANRANRYSFPLISQSLHRTCIQRLGTNSIDSVVIHGMDYAVAHARKQALATPGGDPDAAEEAMKASLEGPDGGLSVLHELKASGRIGAFGVAINEENPIFPSDAAQRIAWSAAYFKRIVSAAARSARDGSVGLGFVLVAGIHTLLNTAAFECGMLAEAQEAGVAVLAAAPFNSGILARDRTTFESASYSYAPADSATIERARALADVCDRHDVSLRAAALAFPLSHPAVVSVIVGAKSPIEWRDCIELLRSAEHIPTSFWADLRSEGLVVPGVPLPCDSS